MKRVILMRHAKSSWSDNNLNDHTRPLNKRGRRDAPIMALKIKEEGIVPQIIFSSDSSRTKETSKYLLTKLTNTKIEYNRQLYHASESTILGVIQEIDDQYDTVMVLAHNPGITDAFYFLANTRIDNVPTSGIGCIEFAVSSFSDIKKLSGQLVYFIYPKMF
jgi:phosphohistidine phosphatase